MRITSRSCNQTYVRRALGFSLLMTDPSGLGTREIDSFRIEIAISMIMKQERRHSHSKMPQIWPSLRKKRLIRVKQRTSLMRSNSRVHSIPDIPGNSMSISTKFGGFISSFSRASSPLPNSPVTRYAGHCGQPLRSHSSRMYLAALGLGSFPWHRGRHRRSRDSERLLAARAIHSMPGPFVRDFQSLRAMRTVNLHGARF